MRAPFADRTVVALLARRFAPQMGTTGMLWTSTRRRLAAAFQKRWRRPLRWRGAKRAPLAVLREQAAALARLFDGKQTGYAPFLMPW